MKTNFFELCETFTSGRVKTQITRYKTLDASGKIAAEGSIAPSAVSIDIHLQGVPNGLYFIQLIDQSGKVLCTQRLVVQQ